MFDIFASAGIILSYNVHNLRIKINSNLYHTYLLQQIFIYVYIYIYFNIFIYIICIYIFFTDAVQRIVCVSCRRDVSHLNSVMPGALEKHRVSLLNQDPEPTDLQAPVKNFRDTDIDMVNKMREKFPEFLPNPDWKHRDRIAEKIERLEMYKRRQNINIPEFYVGMYGMVLTLQKELLNSYAPLRRRGGILFC